MWIIDYLWCAWWTGKAKKICFRLTQSYSAFLSAKWRRKKNRQKPKVFVFNWNSFWPAFNFWDFFFTSLKKMKAFIQTKLHYLKEKLGKKLAWNFQSQIFFLSDTRNRLEVNSQVASTATKLLFSETDALSKVFPVLRWATLSCSGLVGLPHVPLALGQWVQHPSPTPGAPCPNPLRLGPCRPCPFPRAEHRFGRYQQWQAEGVWKVSLSPGGSMPPLPALAVPGKGSPNGSACAPQSRIPRWAETRVPATASLPACQPFNETGPPGLLGAAAKATRFRETNDIITAFPGAAATPATAREQQRRLG